MRRSHDKIEWADFKTFSLLTHDGKMLVQINRVKDSFDIFDIRGDAPVWFGSHATLWEAKKLAEQHVKPVRE